MLQRTEIICLPRTTQQQQQQSAVRKSRAVFCNAQYSAATAVVCAYAHPVDAAHCLVQRS